MRSTLILPTHTNLKSRTDPARPDILWVSGPGIPHPNPRLYKFLCRVFSPESLLEGDEFMEHAPWLCRADYEKETARLLGQGMSCLVYSVSRPRRDPANPWNMEHPRWQAYEFAPSWDEDTDPVVEGGHK